MKPIGVVTVVLLIAFVAAVIGGANKVSTGWQYSAQRAADSRANAAAENIRHQSEINKIDESIAEAAAPQRISFWQTLYISGAIGASILIILSGTGLGICILILSRGVGQAIAIKAMLVHPDKSGRYPLLPYLVEGKLHVLNPHTEAISVFDGEKASVPALIEKSTIEELTRLLASHPDYQDIDVSRLPVANIITGAKALIGSRK